MNTEAPLVRVENLTKLYRVRHSLFAGTLRRKWEFVHAVDGISIEIRNGEVLGLSGMSGCGKTTTGKILALLEPPTSGDIKFDGKSILNLSRNQLKDFRRRVQMVFQDPYQSLDPRFTIYDTLAEPFSVHKIGSLEERKIAIYKMLEKVGLTPAQDFVNRYPHELSGGQRQRVVIARAFILGPQFIVADEPVSMLDVSVRIGILNLLSDLRREMTATYVFISHDLAVQRYICDRIGVMFHGILVEIGKTEEILSDPLHPYTKILLSSVPVPDPTFERRAIRMSRSGDFSSTLEIPSGCRFRKLCPYFTEICKEKTPVLTQTGKDRSVACHLVA